MIFENNSLSFEILDVLSLEQKNINAFNSKRNFDALSFRYGADTLLKTEKQTYHIKDNCVCYFPAGLDYTRISSVDNLIVVHMNVANYFTKNIEFFTPKEPEKYSQLFKKILACWNEKQIGYEYRCTAILYEIMALCYAEHYIENTYNSKIKNSVNYIMENYKNYDISIKEVAEKSFMSEVYFRKLFKEEFGISPQKYIINLRIQNAVNLMSTGYYSLKEVALMSGYNDYKYFSTEFKKLKGVSPSKYVYSFDEI